MIPVSLYLALSDSRSARNPAGLTSFEMKVYGLLHMHLRYDEYRVVKAAWLAHLAHTSRPNIFPVLKRLTSRGYLERIPGESSRQPWRYRLATRHPCMPSIPPRAA